MCVSIDFLTSRMESLKKGNQALLALDIIRRIRYEIIINSSAADLISDSGIQIALELYQKGIRPFESPEFLDQINWDEARLVLVRFLKSLAASGLSDGGLHSLIRDLESDEKLVRHLVTASLEPSLEHISYLGTRYGIEAELLRYLATTSMWPLFKAIRSRIPLNENPISAQRCLLCGSSYSLGVYRASRRILLCSVCGHRIHVDFFWCPNCGNTEPQSMGFIKLEDEPALQLEYCKRCQKYYKFVDEDAAFIYVDDPTVLDLSTVDLDPLGREVLSKESS